MVFPVVMYGCENWTIKKVRWWRILNRGAGEDYWESLDSKEIKPVNPKGNHPEYSLEGLMLKLQNFCHLMWRADSLGKDPDAGKDWGQEEKGVTEDVMVGWTHWLSGHEAEQDFSKSTLSKTFSDINSSNVFLRSVAQGNGNNSKSKQNGTSSNFSFA